MALVSTKKDRCEDVNVCGKVRAQRRRIWGIFLARLHLPVIAVAMGFLLIYRKSWEDGGKEEWRRWKKLLVKETEISMILRCCFFFGISTLSHSPLNWAGVEGAYDGDQEHLVAPQPAEMMMVFTPSSWTSTRHIHSRDPEVSFLIPFGPLLNTL